MHAASHSGSPVGKRAAVALAAALPVVLTGCSKSSSDQAALRTPSTPSSTAIVSVGGPAVTYAGTQPRVGGHPAATAALGRTAVSLPLRCRPLTERSDAHLVSIVWRCGDHISAATVTLDGRPLALGDLLQGSYQQYLSSVAAAQFRAEGDSSTPTTDLGTWYLTNSALAIAFPAGVVSFPLASLQPYLKDPSSL